MRRPNEKDEVFLGAGSLNLLIELEGLAGKVSPHVEQYETVQTRLPQKSRRAEAVGGMDLHAATPHYASSQLPGRLVRVNEENFHPPKNLTAARSWNKLRPQPSVALRSDTVWSKLLAQPS